jgi:tRNA (guanine37-N1)-methyltransferase
MRIDVLTIFPRIFEDPLNESLLGKAQERGVVKINIIDLRDFAGDKHKTVDDRPFGGGAGMVLQVEPLDRALGSIIEKDGSPHIILTEASGKQLDQKLVKELSGKKHLVIICGRYKGVDERIKELYEIQEISLGDFVLSGGEFAALVIIDAVVRLIPGVMGKLESAETDSFHSGLLSYPQYTRPAEYKGLKVPEVLLSGHHHEIERWRKGISLQRTKKHRPDLLEEGNFE